MSIIVRSNEPTPKPEAKAEQSNAVEAKETVQETKPAQEHKQSDSEQNKSEDSGTTETEASEAIETEHEDHADESENDKSTENEGEKPKKKGGFQKRIDKLNTKISAKEQEVEYWKQQALKTQSTSGQTPKPESIQKTNDGKPDPNKFDTHAEYVEALTDWKTEQKFKEREIKQEQGKFQSEQANLVKSYQEKIKEFAKKTKDFNEVVEEVDDIIVNPNLQQMLIASENSPELVYGLAKNRSEFERINKLTPLLMARELGKFESKIVSKSSEQNVENKKITGAPKPLQPVGSGGKGSAPKSIFDSNLTQQEYEALRREQMKRRRA